MSKKIANQAGYSLIMTSSGVRRWQKTGGDEPGRASSAGSATEDFGESSPDEGLSAEELSQELGFTALEEKYGSTITYFAEILFEYDVYAWDGDQDDYPYSYYHYDKFSDLATMHPDGDEGYDDPGVGVNQRVYAMLNVPHWDSIPEDCREKEQEELFNLMRTFPSMKFYIEHSGVDAKCNEDNTGHVSMDLIDVEKNMSEMPAICESIKKFGEEKRLQYQQKQQPASSDTEKPAQQSRGFLSRILSRLQAR